jgi:hypothetical protein
MSYNTYSMNHSFSNFDEFFKNYRKMIEQYFKFSPLYPDSLPQPKKQKPVQKKIFHSTRIKV